MLPQRRQEAVQELELLLRDLQVFVHLLRVERKLSIGARCDRFGFGIPQREFPHQLRASLDVRRWQKPNDIVVQSDVKRRDDGANPELDLVGVTFPLLLGFLVLCIFFLRRVPCFLVGLLLLLRFFGCLLGFPPLRLNIGRLLLLLECGCLALTLWEVEDEEVELLAESEEEEPLLLEERAAFDFCFGFCAFASSRFPSRLRLALAIISCTLRVACSFSVSCQSAQRDNKGRGQDERWCPYNAP